MLHCSFMHMANVWESIYPVYIKIKTSGQMYYMFWGSEGHSCTHLLVSRHKGMNVDVVKEPVEMVLVLCLK